MPDVNREQLDSLPEEVRVVAESFKGMEFVNMIVDKYALDGEQIFLLAELIRKIYIKQIRPSDLPMVIMKIFHTNEAMARKMACDVAGVRLLVVANWFEDNIAHLIEDWGGNPNRYKAHVESQLKVLDSEQAYIKEQLGEVEKDIPIEDLQVDDADITPDAMLGFCKNILKNDLLKYVNIDDIGVLHEINGDFIKLLMDKGVEAKSQLAGALFSNQEKISADKIVLDGKLVDSNIGHWLEYFVRQKGGGLVDAVAIGDFVANSDNAKNLSSKEEEILLKILTLYKNIKFFPDSQNSSDPENWQIFSFIDSYTEKDESLVSRSVLAENFANSEDHLEVSISQDSSLNSVSEDINNKSKITEALNLQKMLEQYPVGSLERMAIEEELKKYH